MRQGDVTFADGLCSTCCTCLICLHLFVLGAPFFVRLSFGCHWWDEVDSILLKDLLASKVLKRRRLPVISYMLYVPEQLLEVTDPSGWTALAFLGTRHYTSCPQV
jgi:hypothetical protein